MSPKSGYRFSDKIVLKEKPAVAWRPGHDSQGRRISRTERSVRANRKEERKAMAGSPDAALPDAQRARSVSPSCSWLFVFRKTDERKPKCSISIALNSIGVDGS